MKRPWSISTTIRNPDRLRDVLKVLSSLEDEKFDTSTQKKFQILLIQNKLYRPTDLTNEEKDLFGSEDPISFQKASEIFEKQNYADPPMRGRMSVAPLSKMGLCIAKQKKEKIKITPLGKRFLEPETELNELFFNHFLKWQLPNPDTNQFTEKNGFSIKPFIGTLHLIKKVNEIWEEQGNRPVGISKEEFSLFVPTLINYQDIISQAKRLIEFRKKCKINPNQRTNYRKKIASSFLGTNKTDKIEGLLQTLSDYEDNIIRYFRITGYIHIRGNGNYVDLEPRRKLEINSILETDSGKPIRFDKLDDYLDYLADVTKPVLPWETISKLKQIYSFLSSQITEKRSELESKSISIPKFVFKTDEELERLSNDELITENKRLREYLLDLEETQQRNEMEDPSKICECIEDLINIYSSRKKFSIELERLTALALIAINDALNVKPNYPVGDDGLPTFTAPANVPDIECFYDKFNLMSEVTMLTSRDQWYNEGQPVMRHLRAFESNNSNKTAFCLFIAPKLHQDTLSTFWISVKYEYQGSKQKIIPLTIEQFVTILKIMKEYLISSGKKLPHTSFLQLYENIVKISENVNSADEWVKEIPHKISEWEKEILN